MPLVRSILEWSRWWLHKNAPMEPVNPVEGRALMQIFIYGQKETDTAMRVVSGMKKYRDFRSHPQDLQLLVDLFVVVGAVVKRRANKSSNRRRRLFMVPPPRDLPPSVRPSVRPTTAVFAAERLTNHRAYERTCTQPGRAAVSAVRPSVRPPGS